MLYSTISNPNFSDTRILTQDYVKEFRRKLTELLHSYGPSNSNALEFHFQPLPDNLVEFHRHSKEDFFMSQLFQESLAAREIIKQNCDLARPRISVEFTPFDRFFPTDHLFDFCNFLHPADTPS